MTRSNCIASVELYIDTKSGESNIEIVESLLEEREPIEETFGEPLTWERLEDKRACRIKKRVSDYGLQDEEQWDETQHKMVAVMRRLQEALDGHIRQF